MRGVSDEALPLAIIEELEKASLKERSLDAPYIPDVPQAPAAFPAAGRCAPARPADPPIARHRSLPAGGSVLAARIHQWTSELEQQLHGVARPHHWQPQQQTPRAPRCSYSELPTADSAAGPASLHASAPEPSLSLARSLSLPLGSFRLREAPDGAAPWPASSPMDDAAWGGGRRQRAPPGAGGLSSEDAAAARVWGGRPPSSGGAAAPRGAAGAFDGSGGGGGPAEQSRLCEGMPLSAPDPRAAPGGLQPGGPSAEQELLPHVASGGGWGAAYVHRGRAPPPPSPPRRGGGGKRAWCGAGRPACWAVALVAFLIVTLVAVAVTWEAVRLRRAVSISRSAVAAPAPAPDAPLGPTDAAASKAAAAAATAAAAGAPSGETSAAAVPPPEAVAGVAPALAAGVAPAPAAGVAPMPAAGVAPMPAAGVAPAPAVGVAPAPAAGVAPAPAAGVAPASAAGAAAAPAAGVAPAPAAGVAPASAAGAAAAPAAGVAPAPAATAAPAPAAAAEAAPPPPRAARPPPPPQPRECAPIRIEPSATAQTNRRLKVAVVNGTVKLVNTGPYLVAFERVGVRMCSTTADEHLRAEADCPANEIAGGGGVVVCTWSAQLPALPDKGYTMRAWEGLLSSIRLSLSGERCTSPIVDPITGGPGSCADPRGPRG